MIELREVKRDGQQMHAKFQENQDTLEKTTQELERQKHSFNEFDLQVKEMIEGMQYDDWEEKR